jgi:staphylococcal nuclease domain-containing protein 1
MGRRAFIPSSSQAGATRDVDVNSTTTAQVPMAAEQKLVPSSSTYSEIPPDRFGREAKHFTETRVLNREVSLLCSLLTLSYYNSELNTNLLNNIIPIYSHSM